MPASKDYYDVLGISKSATDDQIKQAYRKLAREHHPDMVKDSDKDGAEKRFKEINEAYQILSDPQKRKMYDQYGHAGTQGAGFGGQQGPFTYTYSSGNGQSPFGDVNPFDIFEEFFGFRGFGGQRAPKKGKNLHYEMRISFVESLRGVEKTVNTDSGPHTIKIPAGAHDGTELRFSGYGMAGPSNTPNGDLFLTVRVDTPKGFEFAGDQVGVVVELDFAIAALGGVIDVPIIDSSSSNGIGQTQLKIPSGTQYGTRFRLKEKGMPLLRSSGRGEVIVQVIVSVPKKLNKKQKELLEQYKSLI